MSLIDKKKSGALDFIVIGTPKSGTTTLYNWIREHPALFLPEGKELPFFSEPLYEKGIDWYLQCHFGSAEHNYLWGKVTPQYMGGIGEIMPAVIARRIHDTVPDVRLIAILRNPVERAYSHYAMIVRRGHEKRSFESVANEQTTAQGIEDGRAHHTETNCYVATGEYGRILGFYYDLFARDQILVLFDQDLRNDRNRVIREVFAFLGINEDFVPGTLQSDFHKGSSKPKTRFLTPAFLNALPLIPWIWSKAPNRLRRQVNFAINQWNISQEPLSLNPASDVYNQLVSFYAQDKKILEELIQREVPW